MRSTRHKRKAVVRCYLTADQKKYVAWVAAQTELTQSDLVRLLLITATPYEVERLKQHPAYLDFLDQLQEDAD